jgi:hypothetical protein
VVVAVYREMEHAVTVSVYEVGRPADRRSAAPELVRAGGEAIKLARFTGLPVGPDRVYLAEVEVGTAVYRSAPFQLTGGKGALASVFVQELPFLFGFHGGAEIDDDKLWFEMRFFLANVSGRPVAAKDGLIIPLPRGTVGGSVDEADQARVKVDRKRGFVWRGALPPGQREFIGGFALPVEDGVVDFEMPVPYGVESAQLIFGYARGVTVLGPAGVSTRVEPPLGQPTRDGRRFLIVSDISIAPGDALKLRISGLPQPPSWHGWARLGVGLSVLGLCVLAGTVAVRGKTPAPPAAADLASRLERDRLYEQLVALEKQRRGGTIATARYETTRATLVAKLRRTYADAAGS